MTRVEVYKNNKLVDEGVFISGKHWHKDYPDQLVSIADDGDLYKVDNERTYDVKDGYNFQEYDSYNRLCYDSDTKIDYDEQRREQEYNRMVTCLTCHEDTKKGEQQWVNDRYGIPYKLCCPLCVEETEQEIGNWEHDYLDAGEYLEEEY